MPLQRRTVFDVASDIIQHTSAYKVNNETELPAFSAIQNPSFRH